MSFGQDQEIRTKEKIMKWICSMFLMTVLLFTSAPAMYALQSGTGAQGQDADADNQNHRRKKRKEYVPEGSGGVILVLAAGAVGGGLLVWRKKRASAA
jgi:hypothetical protein